MTHASRIALIAAIVAAAIAMSQARAFTQGKAPTMLRFPELPDISPLGVRNDLPNPYRTGMSWGQLPDGRTWGSSASVTVGPDGNIWVLDRCGVKPQARAGHMTCGSNNVNPIFEFDVRSGKLLKNFGGGLFVNPHSVTVDNDGNVWVADNGGVNEGKGHQVFKLSPSGKVLLTLGKAGVVGPSLDTFDQPVQVVVASNGDLFVADGHGYGPKNNARIMKFDKNGKFIKTWGTKGTGPGQFDCPHALAFDSAGRLFVADRRNNRIQIFDQDGKFIAEWKQFGSPSGIFIDKNDVIYVSDSESRDGGEGPGFNPGVQRGIRIGSARDGTVKYFIPDPAPYPYKDGWPTPDSLSAITSMAEGVAADAQGNVYGAENSGTDVKKYVKAPQ